MTVRAKLNPAARSVVKVSPPVADITPEITNSVFTFFVISAMGADALNLKKTRCKLLLFVESKKIAENCFAHLHSNDST
jgi:hypothetical protein